MNNDTLRQVAIEILSAVGGKENVKALTHCLTRLRFILNDESKVDKKQLDSISLVTGYFLTNGSFQIVIGAGIVNKICDILLEIAKLKDLSKEDINKISNKHLAKKTNIFQRGIKALAEIFIPILPAIVTAGLLLGLNNILSNSGVFYENKSFIEVHPNWEGLANMILVLATTAFLFLPALIGWSATKKFGGSPLLGMVFGIALVHPDLLSQYLLPSAIIAGDVPTWNLFGMDVNKVGYQGQVLPVLIASYFLAKVEICLNKHTPDMIKLIIVFPVSLLVVGILTFIIIGPVTLVLSEFITNFIVGLFAFAPLLGGLVYGAIYAPLVITGMHNIFLAVDLQLIGTTGSTFLWPILALSNIAQGTAAFTMLFIVKKASAKALPLSSSISAWLGITEPAMFGVNLRYKFPFVAAIISTSIAGAFIMINHVKAQSVGIGGIPAFLSIINNYWLAFFIGMAMVIVLPLILTYVFSKLSKNKSMLYNEGLLEE